MIYVYTHVIKVNATYEQRLDKTFQIPVVKVMVSCEPVTAEK